MMALGLRLTISQIAGPLRSGGLPINVAAATQNQALSALLFLYKNVLGVELPWLDEMVRAQRPVRLPVVPSEAEVRRLLERLDGGARLMTACFTARGDAAMGPVANVFAQRRLTLKGSARRKRGCDATPCLLTSPCKAAVPTARTHGAYWIGFWRNRGSGSTVSPERRPGR